MGVGGDGVADPAGGGPGRPVGAAHGALAAPGRGPGAEGVRLGLSVLLCGRIIYFSLITNVSPRPYKWSEYLQFFMLIKNLFVVDNFMCGHNELGLGVPLMVSNVISRNRGGVITQIRPLFEASDPVEFFYLV